jgi:hypothetical protein
MFCEDGDQEIYRDLLAVQSGVCELPSQYMAACRGTLPRPGAFLV